VGREPRGIGRVPVGAYPLSICPLIEAARTLLVYRFSKSLTN
jgi:hypothetical protein